MPLGTTHSETGLLLREGRWFILARDDGGRWRLDADAEVERLVGQRVLVHGVRAGFDLLDVRSIERV